MNQPTTNQNDTAPGELWEATYMADPGDGISITRRFRVPGIGGDDMLEAVRCFQAAMPSVFLAGLYYICEDDGAPQTKPTAQAPVIEATTNWFVEVKQMPEEPTPSVRQTAFYLGMQLEELSEKLDVVLPRNPEWPEASAALVATMKNFGRLFKDGQFDYLVTSALRSPEACNELLDGDCDLLWVTIGAARAMGSDLEGAYGEVLNANYSKRWPSGEFHLAPNGKVLKPEGWRPADLKPFLHPTLQPKQGA